MKHASLEKKLKKAGFKWLELQRCCGHRIGGCVAGLLSRERGRLESVAEKLFSV